jgi:high-affinity iron transporter
VISYNVYWIAVIIGFLLLRYKETKGHLPFMKAKPVKGDAHVRENGSSPASSGIFDAKHGEKDVRQTARTVSG